MSVEPEHIYVCPLNGCKPSRSIYTCGTCLREMCASCRYGCYGKDSAIAKRRYGRRCLSCVQLNRGELNEHQHDGEQD